MGQIAALVFIPVPVPEIEGRGLEEGETGRTGKLRTVS